MTSLGWAVASVDYRLSTTARFPAQIHDIKAAIRFLRASAAAYGYPPDKFVIAGSSAGGHLAALVGVTNGHAGPAFTSDASQHKIDRFLRTHLAR